MTAPIPRDASFVVRIWWEHPAGGEPVFRGRAEHTPGGEVVYFDNLRSLEAFIRRWSGCLPEGDEPPAAKPESEHKAPAQDGG